MNTNGVSMRVGRPVATLLLAMGLVGAVSGCEAVQGASDAANQVNDAATKASLCIDALKLAGFTPDLSDPAKAVEESHKKAEELSALAAKTGDTTLKQAIEGVSTTMSSVTLSDLDPQSAATWAQEKLDLVAKLGNACGN